MTDQKRTARSRITGAGWNRGRVLVMSDEQLALLKRDGGRRTAAEWAADPRMKPLTAAQIRNFCRRQGIELRRQPNTNPRRRRESDETSGLMHLMARLTW